MSKKSLKNNIVVRAPIVAVLGHIDHGKSTLLDFIRKENTVDKESGGITQHAAAYKVSFHNKDLTFIDTPGHEAFEQVRKRGASIADIAVLVVACDDGVAEQTKSALAFIKDSGIPFVVALNKIDKPNADIEKTKMSLLENEVYLEKMGGDIPWVEISAKTGEGVDKLLQTVILMSELEEFSADLSKKASGYVLESSLDPKKGLSATLILKEGSLKSGDFIVSGACSAPTRILLDFKGKNIKEASASEPVNVYGFDCLPKAGDTFKVFSNKKEAKKEVELFKNLEEKNFQQQNFSKEIKNIFPLIIKADTAGSVEAILHQIKKIKNERSAFKIILSSCGNISENDLKMISANPHAGTIVGFHVNKEKSLSKSPEKENVEIKIFDIIYELADYLEQRLIELTPKEKFMDIVGEAEVLKVFSLTNKGGVIGGEVVSGEISISDKLDVIRRGEKIATAEIKELQSSKQKRQSVSEGEQFGMNLACKVQIAPKDILKAVRENER